MSSFLLVLHDIAPETWSDYRSFVDELDALGQIPITWLVVPNLHHRQPLEAHAGVCRRLEARLGRGDELALHGYFHSDDGKPPRMLGDWLMRRIYTREGEFYRLGEVEARQRLERGMELFRRLGWPLHGFVAPAWLMSPGARRALCNSGLSYTSSLHHLYRLPDFQALAAPGLTWSARSAWRRGMSRLVSAGAFAFLRRVPILRLGLHPVDMRHEFSRAYWLRLLRQLLEDGRRPLTKIDWLRQQEQGARA